MHHPPPRCSRAVAMATLAACVLILGSLALLRVYLSADSAVTTSLLSQSSNALVLLLSSLFAHTPRGTLRTPRTQLLLARIGAFQQDHLANNRSHAIGLRGVSWIHKHLNGTLLVGRVSYSSSSSAITVHFQDVSEEARRRCPADLANLVSIYVRLVGPEVVAALASPVPGKCEWQATLQVSRTGGQFAVQARLWHFNGGAAPPLPPSAVGDCDDEQLQRNSPSFQRGLRVLHTIPRVDDDDAAAQCRQLCSVVDLCEYSIQQPGTCYLLAASSSDGVPHTLEEASAVFNAIDAWPAHGRPLCRRRNSNDDAWRLSCLNHDDDALIPCANEVEDVVLVEPAAVSVATAAAVAEPLLLLPVCSAKELQQGLMAMATSRWIRHTDTSYYFALPSCRFPWRKTPQELRQCLTNRPIELHFGGDELMTEFMLLVLAQLRLAVPADVMQVANRVIRISSSSSTSPPFRAFVSNFQLPSALRAAVRSLEAIRRDVENEDRELFLPEEEEEDVRMFLTPPFDSERTAVAADVMRQVLVPRSWVEIDLHTLTRDWASTTTDKSIHAAVDVYLHHLCM